MYEEDSQGESNLWGRVNPFSPTLLNEDQILIIIFSLLYKENTIYKFIVSRYVIFAENGFLGFLDFNKYRQLVLFDFDIQATISLNNYNEDSNLNTGANRRTGIEFEIDVNLPDNVNNDIEISEKST